MSTIKVKKIKYEKFVKPNWWKRNRIEALTILIGIIAINIIFFAKTFRETDKVNSETAGQLGDFVGGYIGTFFALVSVVFLFSTLKEQRLGSVVEKFETKYFELIKMHRDNVAEITVGDESGKKIFVVLIREFRAILEITKSIAKRHNQNFNQEQLFIISYYALFFGVGPNSSRMLVAALEEEFDRFFVESFEKALNNENTKNQVKSDRRFRYTPFEGHQSRLGHYYRHLYQIISFVDKQEFEKDKYEYAKTVRAQLTTHEQALLFINTLTPIGNVWWKNGLITRYRFVQNIPFGFFDKDGEIDLDSYFPDDYFEWQERKGTNTLTQPS